MIKNKRMKFTTVTVFLFEIFHCFAQLDGSFLIYNAPKNRCLTASLQWLEVCNPFSPKQQFRWTSGNRILNIAQKKCLGIGKTGNKLQWYLCNAKNDLQQWECTNNLNFKVKNESLYLSLQGETFSLTLSKNQDEKGLWTIHGTTDSVCSQPYEDTYEDNQLWGNCPTRKIDNSWSKNPLTGIYYQVNKESALTWYQARKSCQQQGGELSSITEPHDQTYLSVVHTGSCSSPWIPYLGHCYYLNRSKKTWLKARDACRHDGGDLLSILNVEEQSFTISQLGYLKTDKLWIGLNDLKTAMFFEWSDHSSVPFVSWERNEPSHNTGNKEDCVLIRGEEGKWADEICLNKYGYICKKNANSSASATDTVITSPGCKQGWTRHGYYCYFVGTETKTFEEAKETCKKTESYLVDIASRIENAFLVSLVGMRPEKYFWIGLSNIKDQHTFEWNSSRKVLYTHFNAGMPGGKQGCVAITTGTTAGLWDVLSCTNKEKFICKHMAEDVITTPAPIPTSAPNCSQDWYPLMNRDFCFKLDSPPHGGPIIPQAAPKADIDSLKPELLSSLRSEIAEIFKAELHELECTLGDDLLTIKTDLQATSYENWQEDEPNNYNNVENCVEMSFWWWSKTGDWNDLHCDDKKEWFCEIRRGLWESTNCGEHQNFICKRSASVEINSTAAPTEPPKGGCAPDWVKFQAKCYKIGLEPKTWIEARSYCRHLGGDLASISYRLQQDHFIEPSPTKIPTTFTKLGNDSYLVLQKNLTWSKSKLQCESKGAKLASIRDLQAQAFIELQTSNLKQPLWIGLNSQETDGYFLWIDNWQLNMENWDYNEPKSNHPCVYVDVDGKWKTAYCNQTFFSICKKSPDIAPAPPTQYPGICPEITEAEPKMIWLPYRGHCYAFVTRSVSWSRASLLCLSRDGNVKHSNPAGVVVAVVIAVLVALAGLAYIYHKRTSSQVAGPSYENPMYYTTETPMSEDKDTKTLVDHMENNE
ncbi:Macrophage mannose receptor 1 [Bagarius yarrelli]|uniref:Macrophage mannose receptor 1 n=1 Tax=Bagarius yarrelli TaxID=175774 RepID=A0A556TVE0_BAGYA|nr:Macrophage mannose receptor 1 [Bagarius yarrelli]